MASRPRLVNRAREVRNPWKTGSDTGSKGRPRERAGGNSGSARGAGPKPSRWSAARRRSGCAGRPTLRKRGVALLRARRNKDTASRRSAIPSVGDRKLRRGRKEEEPGHECPGNEETEDTNFVGWVEHLARNPSNPVPQRPAMGVAVAQPILRREAREEKEPGRSNARRERRRLRCLTL
jgi:hypothetical protein